MLLEIILTIKVISTLIINDGYYAYYSKYLKQRYKYKFEGKKYI